MPTKYCNLKRPLNFTTTKFVKKFKIVLLKRKKVVRVFTEFSRLIFRMKN